jgi:hypothetical protein
VFERWLLLSIDGEAVNPARASGVAERLLATPLAHMRRIPRRVLAARPVHVTKLRIPMKSPRHSEMISPTVPR